jgi:hypothetical protein
VAQEAWDADSAYTGGHFGVDADPVGQAVRLTPVARHRFGVLSLVASPSLAAPHSVSHTEAMAQSVHLFSLHGLL